MSKPIVSILMGSDSDLVVMNEAVKVLKEFQIGHEVLILSAHRVPEETANYAKSAVKKGIKIIICGAGAAAHLAGVIAALYPLPVIGVPIKSSALNGLDALFSIVQMPPGVPVATVGINNAKNAGLLAVQILATHDKKLQGKVEEYKNKLAKSVSEKNIKLQKIGINKYLEEVKK